MFGFIIHDPAGPVLVDSGVGVGSDTIDDVYQPVQYPFEEAVRRVGVERREVRLVINSHLHFDHCGNNTRFAGVPIVVQRAEYESASQPGYGVAEWVDFPGVVWEVVDGEVEILDGVTVFPTPGHTLGHQSVLVTAGGTRELIAAQAVYDRDELEAEASVEPLSAADAEATATSARRIKAANPDRVFFSHDARTWPT